jgi:hypothetical protein
LQTYTPNPSDYCRAQAYEKKMAISFFVYFGAQNNNIHTIYKQTSVFVLIFFHVVVLVLLAKQQQNKIVNLYIYIRSQYTMLGPWIIVEVVITP